MAAPNVVSPTTIHLDTAHLALTSSAADIIAAVTTGHAIKVDCIICSNKTSASHPVSLFHKMSGTSYEIAKDVNVPANSTIVFAGVNLAEGDSLTGNSDGSTQIVVNAPYADIA